MMQPSLPDSLLIAVAPQQIAEVERWWRELTDSQRSDFIGLVLSADSDSVETETEQAVAVESDSESGWYEYVVNQDARFYVDRSNGEETSHGYLAYPSISPISSAADVELVSHILTRKPS